VLYEADFAEMFGIRPWEIDRLTYWQWLRLKHRVDERRKGS
jgi:hypothetical protein